jgi:hypothetical protein
VQTNCVNCGVVYKLSPLGQETVLYDFKGVYNGAPDGANPYAGVVMVLPGTFMARPTGAARMTRGLYIG